MPASSITIDDRSANTEHIDQIARLAPTTTRSGRLPSPASRDEQSAADHRQADAAPQESPLLDGHEREAVWIHQRHEHARHKLLNAASKTTSISPGTARMASVAPRTSIPLALSDLGGRARTHMRLE
jgi:hypothetical protein